MNLKYSGFFRRHFGRYLSCVYIIHAFTSYSAVHEHFVDLAVEKQLFSFDAKRRNIQKQLPDANVYKRYKW